MCNFQNKERLVQVLRTLAGHINEFNVFYHALLDLQVSNDNQNQLLRDAFLCSVSERRGASRQRGQDAVNDFDNERNNLFGNLGQEIQDNVEDAHKHLFERLCGLRNIVPPWVFWTPVCR
jgi:hypothetical protein